MSVATYRARRPLKIGDEIRQPGELVPEANSWFRVDHLVHAGHLAHDSVSEEEFAAELARRTAVAPLPEPEAVAPVEDEPEVEATPAPAVSTQPTRAELEAMDLVELRELAKSFGLETIKKAEIIDALAAE